MAKVVLTCPVCGREFEAYTGDGRLWCSVGCQFGSEDEDDKGVGR